MKRRLLLTLTLALLVALAAAVPAQAGEAPALKVNGEPVTFTGLYLEDGYSMIPAEAFARLSGAALEQTAGGVKLAKGKVVLGLAVGSTEARLGDQAAALPVAPASRDGVVFVPLRFVCTTFGFEVGWDAAQRAVMLAINETRDGLTPAELLAKSNLAGLAYKTYAMEGSFDMDLTMTADGVKMAEAPGKMSMKIQGQMQNDPLEFYMKQDVATGLPDAPAMAVEMYMTEEKMYMKVPGQGWAVQKMPIPAELWKQQQDVQTDPLKAAAFMKEMGLFLNYGDDVNIGGKDYYVVNAALDMNKFRQAYQQMIQQVMKNMPVDDAAGPAEMQQMMQKILENMQLDYYYTVYVNKETLITDIVKMDMDMSLEMNNPAGAGQAGAPQVLKMDMAMRGGFTITALNEPFKAPDVSGAVETQ